MENDKLTMPVQAIRGYKYEFENKVKLLLREFNEKTGHHITSVYIAPGEIDAATVKAKVVIEL